MNVLLIGSGGREHAIAEAILRSPKLSRLEVAPGNAGTTAFNIDLDVADHAAVVAHCRAAAVDLVVIGPEAPLVGGLADDLGAAEIACFGPSAAAARLEGSKSFTRSFAARHGIPGPRTASFTDAAEAIAALDDLGETAVVKADGLAAGKGVTVPATRAEAEAAIREILPSSRPEAPQSTQSIDLVAEPIDAVARTKAPQSTKSIDVVVLEEQMVGEELSLFGISDGTTVITLGTAQDHKRVGEGDTGPNTGGMGAFSPVPGFDREREEALADVFLRPTVEGMAAEGSPYVGVLYAGLMFTDDGPKLVEYNCRLGDPEAEVVLPRLRTDLLELFEAAAHGELADHATALSADTYATVVVCADGYPGAPRAAVPIPPIDADPDVEIFHAGTRFDDQHRLVSSGGRVLNVVGRGDDLAGALDAAYRVVEPLLGDGLFARSDIGWRHMPEPDAYAAAGVSLEAGAATTARIGAAVKTTHDERVVAGLGSFGGVFDITALKDLDRPLLVATTDGVGTKTVLAEQLDRWEGCGADIVNHGINDVLVQGATPLFFLDTVASETLDPEVVGRIVDGMAGACRVSNCVLLGGETAEMPGVLTEGSVDIAGTLVGVVDQSKLLPRAGIADGHVLVGIESSGLHTNGYSLARKVVGDRPLTDPLPGGAGESIGDALLAVHRNYLPVIEAALEADLVDALAHITGGGLIDNLPRVLPDGLGADIEYGSWQTPALFQWLIDEAGLGITEACQILNCGIGLVAVVAPDKLDACRAAIDEPTHVIGAVVGRSSGEARVQVS